MAEYNIVNAKLSNSQLNKLKTAVKNRQGTILRMDTRMLSANNLPHEFLLTIIQTTKITNAIENNMSTDIKLSKTQISKIIQSRGFLGKLLGPLLKTGLPLIKNVIKPLAKSVLIPLELTAEVSETIKNYKKEEKEGFLENLLTGKRFVRAGKGTIRASYGSSIKKRSSNSTTSFSKF